MKIEFALRLAEQGFRVFPLQPNGKRPATPDGLHSATRRADIIEAWWADNPQWNIGVATGGAYFVIDADCKDGRTGLADLATMDEMFDLPESVRVLTPSGGVHVYLAKDPDRKLVSNAGQIEGFPGIDIRAEGGYVVGPGSTIDGEEYVLGGDFTVDPCPEPFFPILRKPITERIDAAPAIELDLQPNIARAIDWLINHAPEAVEGAGGDQITYSVAAELRALGISESTSLELMLEHWNEAKASPPWQPDELADKVANGFQYGQGAAGGKTAAGEFGVIDLGDGHPSDLAAQEAGRQSAPTAGRPDTRLKFLTYADMLAMPEPQWLIEDVAQQRRSTLMFGKSNTFKSFLGIDLGLSVATGRPWHGKAVHKGRVLFVATEGSSGVGRLRIPGWYEHHAIPEADRANALLYPKEIGLDVKENVDALIQSIRAWGDVSLVVLDIFAGTMLGAEKDDEVSKAWVNAIERIMRTTGAATLIVAHTGWADETRARMHTHVWGSMDSRLLVEGDKEKLTTCLTVNRHKDADSSGRWGFTLRPSHGTLVLELDASVVADRQAGLAGPLRVAMRALDDAIEKHGILKMGEQWPDCKVVEIEHWKAECYTHGLSPSDERDAKRKAFQRARDALRKRELVDVYDEFVWPKFGQ